jgi:putative transposase
MGWKERCVMDERIEFIKDWQQNRWTITELAQTYGISRKTAYKFIARFKQHGIEGLTDQSRAPQHHPNAVPDHLAAAIVECKQAYTKYGPRKVITCLRREYPEVCWPAVSTASDILRRHGLVHQRKLRRKAPPVELPFVPAQVPNDVWCTDFKGWFCTGDGTRCEPFTVTDKYTRYLLCCQAMTGYKGFAAVKPLFEMVFRKAGLPRVIHSDNGPPFASTGLAGLTKLNVWWMKLGIVHERSRPGEPQDNGRHERMHRTLKEYTAQPPKETLGRQQLAFLDFMEQYNEHRPHEALSQKTPSSIYHPSARTFPERLICNPHYPDDWTVRKVKSSGRFKWRGHAVSLTDALTGEYVGFQPVSGGIWGVHFQGFPIGLFDEHRMTVKPMPKKKKE